MSQNLTAEAAAAAALAHLLAGHPELGSVTWSVGDMRGTLTGRHTAESGEAEIIDVCAEVIGGTVARSTHRRNGDGLGVAQLVTTYRGVPVQVWGSYPLPGPDGLTSSDLAALLIARPLGTVAVLPGVAW